MTNLFWSFWPPGRLPRGVKNDFIGRSAALADFIGSKFKPTPLAIGPVVALAFPPLPSEGGICPFLPRAAPPPHRCRPFRLPLCCVGPPPGSPIGDYFEIELSFWAKFVTQLKTFPFSAVSGHFLGLEYAATHDPRCLRQVASG
jgi:hypothetical protein